MPQHTSTADVHRKLMRTIVAGALLLAVAPAILTLCYELFVWPGREIFRGDTIVIEIHVMDLLRGKQLAGPYSRLGFNHPGPLYYIVLLPLYVVTGHASGSLFLSAALLSAVAAAAMAVAYWRARSEPASRILFAALLGGFLAYFAGLKSLSSPWNPSACVLPFAVYWLLLAPLAAGNLRLLPVIALLHAFVVQTHISYVLCASVALALALALGIAPLKSSSLVESSQNRLRPRTLGFTALVLGLTWALPIWTEISGPSNVAAIVGSYDKVLSRSFSEALALAARELARPVLHAMGVGPEEMSATPIGAALCVVQAVALGTTVRVALARGQRLAFAGSVLGLAGMPLACLSAGHVGKTHHASLTYWFGVVGLLNWLPVMELWLVPWLSKSRAFTAVAAAVPIGLGLAGSYTVIEGYQQHQQSSLSADQRDVIAATDKLAEMIASADPAPVLSRGAGVPNIEGVVLLLRKRGISPLIDQELRYKLGGGFEYRSASDTAHPWLIFNRGPDHAEPILANFGDLYLFRRSRERSPVEPRNGGTTPAMGLPPEIVDWRVQVVSAQGVKGDLNVISDGVESPLTRGGKSPGAVRLSGADSQLVVALPAAPPRGHVEGLRIFAEGRDAYELEGSYDGATFAPIGRARAARRPGVQPRLFRFNDLRAWHYVRLSPAGRARRHSLSELTAVMADGPLVDFGAKEAPIPGVGAAPASGVAPSATRSVELARGAGPFALGPHELVMALEVAPEPSGLAEPALFELTINGRAAGALEVAPTRSLYHRRLPSDASFGGSTAQIELSPVPDRPAPRVRLRAFLLRP
jgi:hypothetical protein